MVTSFELLDSEVLYTPNQTLQAIAIAHDCLPELESKILLLKTLHISITEHGKTKLVLTQKFHPTE